MMHQESAATRTHLHLFFFEGVDVKHQPVNGE